MGVSKNMVNPPKSSILIGFSIITHPFWDTTIFGNIHIASINIETKSPGGVSNSWDHLVNIYIATFMLLAY